MNVQALQKELKTLENLDKKQVWQRFFKTKKGQYGYKDVFIGVCVPDIRKVANRYTLDFRQISKMLDSKIHEFRLAGLFCLINNYEQTTEKQRCKIVRFYIEKSHRINNWDLVDLSAPKIVGAYLLDKKDRTILRKLAKSKNLWQRRIAIVSTYTLIKAKQFEDTIELSNILMNDSHELIHKAVGWMLREVSKRDLGILETFLDKNLQRMPRIMLRYSIEKMSKEKREKYMKKQD
jgi:3-methyladenine DNA glycosylase AlkD